MSLSQEYRTDNYVKEDELVLATPETSVIEIYQMMQKNRIHHIPVVEKGKAVGIISDRDVKFVSYSDGVTQMTAADIMTPSPYSVSETTQLEEVILTMANKEFNSVLIHNNEGKVTGIFTSKDALKILAKTFLN